MKIKQTTDPRVHEIAQVIHDNPKISMGRGWIMDKYNVTWIQANSLLGSAKAHLRNFPNLYNPLFEDWEYNVIVPDAHKFTPANLYNEVEVETFIITKQSKLNYD